MQECHTLADLQKWDLRGGKAHPPIRLGLFGDPVAHSLSPPMQNAALQKCGLDMQYARFQIRPDELGAALRLLPGLGFVGVNLTVPHKIAALAFMGEVDPCAQKLGAINTIRIEKEKLLGFNTDGLGFARALRQEFSVDLRDLRVLLLGAGGGAGRAIAMQCANDGCRRLVLVNRDAEKAQQLAAELKQFFAETRVSAPVARLEPVPWDERALRFQLANVDLVVNATSLGLKRSDPPVLAAPLLAPHLLVYDTIYAPERTPLLRAAAEAGARGANGRSMLLHQGALAFEKWFGRDAPVDVMARALTG